MSILLSIILGVATTSPANGGEKSVSLATPSETMSTVIRAVENIDQDALIRCFSQDSTMSAEERRVLSRMWITDARLFHCAEAKFGHDQALALCQGGGVSTIAALDPCVTTEWTKSEDDPNTALIKLVPGFREPGIPSMHRDKDGLWRIAISSQGRAVATEKLNKRTLQVSTICRLLEVGVYRTPEEVSKDLTTW